MIILCNGTSCSEPAKYFCQCKVQHTLLCSAHTAEHIDENESAAHTLNSIYRTASSEKKAFVLEQCALVQEGFKDLELSITTSFQDVISSINEQKTELIKYFREQRESLELIIDKISNENKEIILPGYEVIETYQPNCISYLKFVANQIFIEARIFRNTIKSYSNKMQNCKNIFGEYLDYDKNINLDEHLYGFKDGTKTFVEYNTLTLTINKKELNTEINQGCLASLCQIPKKKLFYLGGNTAHCCYAYIIDLKTFSLKKIAKTRDRSRTFATYYNDFIYMFGGYYSNKYLSNCEKYNLKTKEWKNISDFPATERYLICALPYKDYLMLSNGAKNNLYQYVIATDTYYSLTSTVENSLGNLLFKNLNKVYYISARSLFTSTEESFTKWIKSQKNLSVELVYNTSKPVTRGKFVYIMSTSNNKIYKFDLEEEDLLEVTSY